VFPHRQLPFSFVAYIRALRRQRPDVVILFLHLKDIIIFPLIAYCRIHGIKVIYWNHGINIGTPHSRLKNAVFHAVHDRCDALITYSEEMRRNFTAKNQSKLFVANNTLSFSDVNRDCYRDRHAIKEKLGIKEKHVILCVSRFLAYKKPMLLAELFADVPDVAVVYVGPDYSAEALQIIDAHPNLYYFGERYGEQVNEIFAIGDVFSTPGHIGLALNEAFFWGLPVVVLQGIHAPEICYMKDGVTGFIAENARQLKEQTLALLRDEVTLARMRRQVNTVFEQEISMDRMYSGFYKAVQYVLGGKR